MIDKLIDQIRIAPRYCTTISRQLCHQVQFIWRPSSSEYSDWSSIIICKEPLIITGDFSIHVDMPSESCHFSEFILSMSLVQHVRQPTHGKGQTIDFIITRSSDKIISSEPVADELFSDHFSLHCHLSILRPQLSCKTVTYRPKDIDFPLFFDDLTSSKLCPYPPDVLEELEGVFNTTLRSIYDHHASSESKVTVSPRRVPWFTKAIA